MKNVTSTATKSSCPNVLPRNVRRKFEQIKRTARNIRPVVDDTYVFKALLALAMDMTVSELEKVLMIIHGSSVVALADVPDSRVHSRMFMSPEEYLINRESLELEMYRLRLFDSELSAFPGLYGVVIRRHYGTDCESEPEELKPLSLELGIKHSFAAAIICRVWRRFRDEGKPYSKEWLIVQIQRVQRMQEKVSSAW